MRHKRTRSPGRIRASRSLRFKSGTSGSSADEWANMKEGDSAAAQTVEEARQRVERFFRNKIGVFSLEDNSRVAILADGKPIGSFRVVAGSLADMANSLDVARPTTASTADVNRALRRKMPGFSVDNEAAFVPVGSSGEEVWQETLHVRYRAAKDPWQWPLRLRLVWLVSRRTGMSLARTRTAAVWLCLAVMFWLVLVLFCLARPSGWRYLLQIGGRVSRKLQSVPESIEYN